MYKNVLSDLQIEILKNLPYELKDNFVLGGGTALAAFHLQHRKSEDFDFFAINKGDFSFAYLENILKKKFKIENKDKIFDRKIFIINSIKLEFVPLYFDRIEEPKISNELNIFYETINDLSANKILAMADRTDIKDYIDIFFICKEKKYNFLDVVNLAIKKQKNNYEYLLNFDNLEFLKRDFNNIKFIKECSLNEIVNFFKKAKEELKDSGFKKICEKLENYNT